MSDNEAFEQYELPSGWSWCALADVVTSITDGPFGSNLKTADYVPEGVRVIRLGNIGVGEFIDDDRSFVSHDKYAGLRKHEAVAGDIVMAALAEPVGRACLVPSHIGTAIVKADCVRARVDPSVAAEIVTRWLNSPAGLKSAELASHGIGRLRINLGEIRALAVPLPPMNEQRRIVAKLDAIFEQTRAAKARLERLPALLEKLKRSILAAAFRGDLTKDWRAAHPNVEPASAAVARGRAELAARVKSRTGGRNVDSVTSIEGRCALAVNESMAILPATWVSASISDIAQLESGHTPSRGNSRYWDGPFGWIGIRDARDHHGRSIDTTEQTVTKEGLDNSAARLLPVGTVCVSRTASIGYVVVMGAKMATSQDFANWVCTAVLEPRFLMYAFLAEDEDGFRRFGKGTTHTTIYYPELKALHIRLPPIEEQREIVSRLDVAMAALAPLATRVDAATARVDDVQQAALSKAFRGELVPQDPTEEPASALLERIRAARAAEPERPRRGRGPRRADAPPTEPTATAPSNGHASNGHTAHAAHDESLDLVVGAFQIDPRLTSTAITEATGLDAAAVKRALKILVEAGQVRIHGRARATTYEWTP